MEMSRDRSIDRFRRLLLLLLLVVVVLMRNNDDDDDVVFSFVAAAAAAAAGSSSSFPPCGSSSPHRRRLLLLLDVDNTLYDEASYQIEAQIAERIRAFCAVELQNQHEKDRNKQNQGTEHPNDPPPASSSSLSSSSSLARRQADELHRQFGSTVEGLRQTAWRGLNATSQLRERQEAFYDAVYRDIDCRSLLLSLSPPSPPPTAKTTARRKRQQQQQQQQPDDDLVIAEESNVKTGYSPHHCAGTASAATAAAWQQDQVRRILLQAAAAPAGSGPLPRAMDLHLASNSPLLHVQKVVQAVGLARVPWKGLWTPDCCCYCSFPGSSSSPNDFRTSEKSYPTKRQPRAFFRGADFLRRTAADGARAAAAATAATLIDDSAAALAAVDRETDIGTVWLQQPNNGSDNSDSVSFPQTLPQALGVALGWFHDPQECGYAFSDVRYLRAKRCVDQRSIHGELWQRLRSELARDLLLLQRQPSPQQQQLHVVDVGAGLLSMLELVLHGSEDHRLPSLASAWPSEGAAPLEEVHYYAYEPNRNLEAACVQVLQSMGFTLQVQTSGDGVDNDDDDDDMLELVFVRRADSHRKGEPRCTVYLRFWDFRREWRHAAVQSEQPTPHVIVGCCFADLLEPHDLVASLLRCFLSGDTTSAPWSRSRRNDEPNESSVTSSLVYFPITFAGTTQFLPPQPFEPADDQSGRNTAAAIPSDTTAFSVYSKCLSERLGHNLDPYLIESAMGDYGGVCLGRGKSDWIIECPPSASKSSAKKGKDRSGDYLWQTMLYFLASVAAPELHCQGWDARGWLDRARERRPTIQASNVDLLFRLPHLGAWNLTAAVVANNNNRKRQGNKGDDVDAELRNSTYEEILFIGPREVTTVTKNTTSRLAPDEIRIQTLCSLISSGTELKVFTGSFDDAALDVNIQGMDEECMAYPLAYGYSLVGSVVEIGSDVEESLLGENVFTFAAHASQVVTTQSAVQRVPDGCDPLDAIFMPSVETALSLVQDARPVVGENVAVFGQGLIGLLVTAILSQRHKQDASPSAQFGTVSTFDTLPDRLAASAAMGASQALFPTEANQTLPFDVAIEVSGNSRALQTAIDRTRDGGRILIGSWYGNANVLLKLGIDFHRSHKSLQVSQVSEISAELSKTWSKERRFALTWELVRGIRPSRLLTRRIPLCNAQQAFESLEKGDEIAVAFEYDP